MHDKSFLVRLLRDFDQRLGSETMAVIDVMFEDRFDFNSLGPCSNCGIPGLNFGQLDDWRVAADDGPEGLHGLVRADGVAFHLDKQDACRNPLAHGMADTRLLRGAALGGLAFATLVALVGGKPRDVAAAGAVGVGVGGAIGGHVPARRASVIRYRDLFVPISPQPLPAWP